MEDLRREVYEDIVNELKNAHNLTQLTLVTVYYDGYDWENNCPEKEIEVIKKYDITPDTLSVLDELYCVCDDATNPEEVDSESEYISGILMSAYWISKDYSTIEFEDTDRFESVCELLEKETREYIK